MALGPSAWSLRKILDYHLKFVKAGLPVYLRTEAQVDDAEDYPKYGFQRTITPSVDAGVLDILIAPPPDVEAMSMHNIGITGGRLNFGATKFLISHTFVIQQMNALGLTDPYQVFRAANVMGLYYNQRLFSIESLTPTTAGGQIISWDVVCNSLETTSPVE